MSNQPYHNQGFGVAFLWIIALFIVFPAIMILSIDDGFAKFVQMTARFVSVDLGGQIQHYGLKFFLFPRKHIELGDNCKHVSLLFQTKM